MKRVNTLRGGGVGGNRAKSVTHKINGKDRKFPIKDAWRREHNSYNESEKYEVPLSSRKKKRFDEGGGVENGYMVFNYTDNLYANYDIFATKKEANNFIKEFRNRYKQQGYYRDSNMNKIDVEDIDLEIIPSDFNPLKKFNGGGGVDELNYGERGKKGYIEDSIKSNKRIIDLMQKYLDTDLEENSEKALSNRNKVREDMNKLKAEVLHLQDEISTYQGGGDIKASDLSNWDKKLDAGEDVVVYDKNGVKYIYQGSSYEKDSVAVMKGFDESTYRMMPLSEIKSIEIGSMLKRGIELS
jgi:hypothetical protein